MTKSSLTARHRLKIGIDINEANVANRVGTGQYAYHILAQLFTLAKNVDFTLYHRDVLQPDMPAESPHWHYRQVGPARAWLRLGLPLNLLLTQAKYHSFWSPAHYTPSYLGSPSVVTIHDLAYEYFPDLFLPSDLYKLKNWTKLSVTRAKKVIAVSSATKDDLVRLYGTDPDKIQVIYNGYDSQTFNMSTATEDTILSNYHLQPRQFLLFLGTIQPRKNVIKLVQAFQLMKKAGYSGKLVIAGNIGWMAEETLLVIQNSPVSKDIIMTGYITDTTKLSLYRHADVFVLPSLYEGFGVPIIEAMASGAPVAAANNSSLPEVVGDAGKLFDAHDPVDMMQAILALQKDRAAWVKKSLLRAQKFSWDKCARETLQVLSGDLV